MVTTDTSLKPNAHSDGAAAGPLALIAEITHRCPLHCVYCSNPIELIWRDRELPVDVWIRVLGEAAEMGALQVDFTGGEPLARTDLRELIQAARAAGLYVNLITSGLPLDEKRLDELVAAGLDHLQLSFQGARPDSSEEFAGLDAFARKRTVAQWAAQHRIALTLNFVIHRRNLNQLDEMIALAEEIKPSRVEFSHVQYYGWAFANLQSLLPTREQFETSLEVLKNAEERLRGRVRLEYVVPDYYAKFPKACMGGWGRKMLLIDPSGDAMPCHAASIIPGIKFENVRTRPLRQIWQDSGAFRRFRGENWMPEPCRSCDRRKSDFGGCRCQAYLLVRNAAVTDPVCSLSPQRDLVDRILSEVNGSELAVSSARPGWLYRPNPR